MICILDNEDPFYIISATDFTLLLRLLHVVAVAALQVIQQSTGLDLGWQDDPCSPIKWDQIGCEGNIVTSLYVHRLYKF